MIFGTRTRPNRHRNTNFVLLFSLPHQKLKPYQFIILELTGRGGILISGHVTGGRTGSDISSRLIDISRDVMNGIFLFQNQRPSILVRYWCWFRLLLHSDINFDSGAYRTIKNTRLTWSELQLAFERNTEVYGFKWIPTLIIIQNDVANASSSKNVFGFSTWFTNQKLYLNLQR